ncbi:MAG: hypothetical protein RL839_11365 [Gammaproteobacteria bacterium]
MYISNVLDNELLKASLARWAIVFAVSASCTTTAIAQDPQVSSGIEENFALFEPLDVANNSASAAENARNNAASRATRNTLATPTFSLVGTSRIGTRHTALLKHLSGEIVKVPLTGNGIIPIPGHDIYTVLRYGAGELAIRYPAAIPCGDFPEQGVSCDSRTNIATLSLTTAEPIIAQVAPEESAVSETDIEAVDTGQAEETVRRNPFAVLRDRNNAATANSSTQAAPTSRFQPRRIDPNDVPPGYRVVSTPFGDRLVEQQ